jgi:uncharacterized membrane protein
MLLMVTGLLLFLGIHFIPTFVPLRTWLIDQFGEMAYKGLFSLVSLLGLALIVYGFSGRGGFQVWSPPAFMRHVTFLLMLPVFVLLAAAYIPSHIRTYVGHPMLAAVSLWALAHLLVNGDLAGIVLFGCFLAWSLSDWVSASRRNARGPMGGALGGLRGDVLATAIGLAFYVFMLVWGHEHLIGLPLIGSTLLPS